jgi:hypothetical protein
MLFRPPCVLRALCGEFRVECNISSVASWDDVVAIARQLPSTEVSTWYHTPGLKVAGKGFARLRTECDGGLVLMCSLDEKERLLDAGEPAYYTTPHYDGYGAILINLAKIDRAALRELVVQSWRTKAPRKLQAALEPARTGFQPDPAPPKRRARKRRIRSS